MNLAIRTKIRYNFISLHVFAPYIFLPSFLGVLPFDRFKFTYDLKFGTI